MGVNRIAKGHMHVHVCYIKREIGVLFCNDLSYSPTTPLASPLDAPAEQTFVASLVTVYQRRTTV